MSFPFINISTTIIAYFSTDRFSYKQYSSNYYENYSIFYKNYYLIPPPLFFRAITLLYGISLTLFTDNILIRPFGFAKIFIVVHTATI